MNFDRWADVHQGNKVREKIEGIQHVHCALGQQSRLPTDARKAKTACCVQLHHWIAQHPLSAFGVHPTCSVSTTSSGPGCPPLPTSRRQYVVPGSNGSTSTFTVPAPPPTCLLLDPSPSQDAGCSFHCNVYEDTPLSGWNWIVIQV